MGSQEPNVGRWTDDEHNLFLDGLRRFSREWKKIAEIVRTRTVVQVRTHAQKYFQKLAKEHQPCPIAGVVTGCTSTAQSIRPTTASTSRAKKSGGRSGGRSRNRRDRRKGGARSRPAAPRAGQRPEAVHPEGIDFGGPGAFAGQGEFDRHDGFPRSFNRSIVGGVEGLFQSFHSGVGVSPVSVMDGSPLDIGDWPAFGVPQRETSAMGAATPEALAAVHDAESDKEWERTAEAVDISVSGSSSPMHPEEEDVPDTPTSTSFSMLATAPEQPAPLRRRNSEVSFTEFAAVYTAVAAVTRDDDGDKAVSPAASSSAAHAAPWIASVEGDEPHCVAPPAKRLRTRGQTAKDAAPAAPVASPSYDDAYIRALLEDPETLFSEDPSRLFVQ